MANPVVNPRFKAWLASGVPNAGGFLFTYAAGTSTPLAVYTNPQLTVAATNPVLLDSNGEALVYGSGLQYKLVCQDSLGVQLWSADFVSIGAASGSGVAVTWTPTGALTTTVAQTMFASSTGTPVVLIDRLAEFNSTTGVFTATQAGVYTARVSGYFTGSGAFTVVPPSFVVSKSGPTTVQPIGYGPITTLGTTVYPDTNVEVTVALTAGQTLSVAALATFTGAMSVGNVVLTITAVPTS